jgi:hypothetical protein
MIVPVSRAPGWRCEQIRQSTEFDWGHLIVLGLSLPVLWPLVGPSYLSFHDGLHHLYRVLDLDDWAIPGGVLYPRRLPNLGFGYGYPVLNYYAPLSYYLAEVFHILGARYIDSTNPATSQY